MKKLLIFLCISSLVYHIHPEPIKFNFDFMKKKTSQKIEQTIPVPKNARVELYNTQGSITIKPWGQPKIALDIVKSGTQEVVDGTSVTSKVSGSEVLIRTHPKDEKTSAQVDYTLRVPEDVALKIVQAQGSVTIAGIEGDIDISLEQGAIDIKGSKKSVTAHTVHGSISVSQAKLLTTDSIFLQASDSGSITLALPPETNASLYATVQNGTIQSDHPITMVVTTKLDRGWTDRLKKEIKGMIGKAKTGGELASLDDMAPITLEVARGTIQIKEL